MEEVLRKGKGPTRDGEGLEGWSDDRGFRVVGPKRPTPSLGRVFGVYVSDRICYVRNRVPGSGLLPGCGSPETDARKLLDNRICGRSGSGLPCPGSENDGGVPFPGHRGRCMVGEVQT